MKTETDQFERRSGPTYKARMPDEFNGSLYVTINHDDDGNIFELFARKDGKEYYELATVITRLASMALREGVSPEIIADELMEIHSPITSHMIPGTAEECPSITARIGRQLKEHIDGCKDRTAADSGLATGTVAGGIEEVDRHHS